ncbi:MAG: aspartyl protease family protein [Candidatus Hodarchaeota archaeon]
MKMKIAKESGHIHLPVYINEKGPFDFTLDTGAGMTVISKVLADQLGIETYQGAKAKASGVGGTPIPVKSAMVESLQLGTETFLNKEVVVIDLGPAMGAGCLTPGVLGQDILKDYIVQIDYRASTVQLDKQPGSKIMAKDGVEWIPFQYVQDTHLMRVPVYINTQGPFELILDTGSSGTVITPTLATELGITENPSQSSEEQQAVQAQGCSQGVCTGPIGVATGFAATLEKLAVGTATQENVAVGVIDLNVVSPKGDKIDYGILGYPFLKNYTLIIDYPNRRLAMVR